MYKSFIKRGLDIILSLFAIILLAVPMLIIALVIVIDDPGSALYTQKRVGKDKTLFKLYKFRSMKMNTPELPTHLLENPEQYTSKVGKFIRKTSIDELPQLFNILIGQMSIVGPRPALWTQSDLIAQRDQYGANDIRPGLTGWAQINGRNKLNIETKSRLDGEYARNISFAFDLKCFLGTIKALLKSEVAVEGEVKKNEEVVR